MNVSLDPNWRTRVRRDNLSEEEEKEGEKEEVHFPCCPFNFYFCILSRCEEESVKFFTATNCSQEVQEELSIFHIYLLNCT